MLRASLAALLVTTGCLATGDGAGDNDTDGKGDGTTAAVTDVCKTEHAGETPNGTKVTVCDELFDEAPFVRLPADKMSGTKVTVFGAILNGLGLVLYTADGRQLVLVNASGDTYPISRGPTGFKAPENLFALYAVKGTKTQKDGQDAIKVSELAPVAWIPGSVQDARLLGTWQAQASSRKSDGRFDATTPVTLRFTLSTTTERNAMWDAMGAGDGLTVAGAIDNFDKQVSAADGTCLPSLASLGASSPFYQASQNRVALWRHPNMHGLNDQVIVLDYPTGSSNLSPNGMGWIGPFSVAGLVREAGPNTEEVEIYPHATPNGHRVWGFTKVAASAECP